MVKTSELINLVNQSRKSQTKATALKTLETKLAQKREAIWEKYIKLCDSLRAQNSCQSLTSYLEK